MGTANAQTDAEQHQHGNEEASPGGVSSKTTSIKENATMTTTSIEAFFAETVILITGATGFLGKALLEKLLRSCPRLATIFVLIRPKKGQTVEERFQNLIENPVFDRLKWEMPGAVSKVLPIKGDVGLPGLGLTNEDRTTLTQRVNIIFHSAATVRFDEPLKFAVNLNTKGTDRILELARGMKNLISFVHISTAYSNADQRDIKEMIYSTKVKPHTLIDMCENLDDETLSLIEKRLMGKHPNTYTLTKGLAESLVMTKGAGLPIAIVRPSIVGAAYQEPFPGWVDNLSGITGIVMEIGRGTIRSIICKPALIVDIIPVDFVVDTLICASWHSAMRRNNTIKVYNCTSGTLNPIRWCEFSQLTNKHAIQSPSKYVMWYPNSTFRTNKLIHKVACMALHYVPAFIVDLALKFQGGKPMMMKMAKRVERAAETGEFFTVREWMFQTDNIEDLVKKVKLATDTNRFNVDIKSLDWDSYVHQYTLGIRKYILKDNPDTLSAARNRLVKLYWVHRFTQALSAFVLIKIVTRAVR